MSIILDGKGRGYRAAVTPDQRLRTESVSIDPEDDAIRVGEGWQITSAPITFTDASPSGILYLRNNGQLDLVLDRAVLLLGTSTGGTGDWTFQTLRNPGDYASDTLLTNGVTAGISNSNHGSQKLPDAEYFRGVPGDTLTGGTGAALPIQPQSNRTVYPFGRRLPLGSSVGFKLTPPTGNTNAVAVLVTHVYYDQTDG
jgi:hypothetical protein